MMIEEDKINFKKTQKTQIYQKDYIKIRPEAPGVQATGLDPNLAIIGTADSGKHRCIAPEGT